MMFLRQFRHFILDCLGQFKSRRDLLILFAFAMILRLGYFILMLGQISYEQIMTLAPDSIRYVGLGKEFLNWRIMDEMAVLHFGPGYGAFLGTNFFLFGVNPIGVLLVQILLSALCCLLIYRFGYEITRSRTVGYIAGILLAVSFTSISLANFILSDTLFFFLFLWGNLAFLLALNNRKISYFVLSGICIGLAILTRSIGQFWPLAMVAMVFVLPLDDFRKWQLKSRMRLLKKAWVAPMIAIVLMSVWMARNYHHHSVPMLTFSSAGGPANVAAITLARIQNKDANDILLDKIEVYLDEQGIDDINMIDRYRLYRAIGYETFAEYPLEMIYTSLGLAWINLNEVNQLFPGQIPAQSEVIGDIMQRYRDLKLNYICFILSIAGIILFLIRRHWRALLLLGSIYLYFIIMIGFTQWQGSRLFYPGQIAGLIIIAHLMVWAAQVWKRFREYLTMDRKTLISFDRFECLAGKTWIVAILLLVSGIYIWHSLQYGAFIIDDAGISYTYAQNLVDGNGLVVNPGGEKIEGYTNPLWVFIIALFMKIGLFNPIVTPKVISIIFTIASFAIIFRLFTKLRPGGFSVFAAYLTTLAIAANSSLTVWSVSGLENGLYNFLIIYAAYRLIFEIQRKFRWQISGVIFFLVALTRPDGIVFVIVAFGFAAIFAISHPGRRQLLINILFFVVLFGIYHLWHYYYFAEYLSNTYFAKRRYAKLSEMFFNPDWYGRQYILNGIKEHKIYWLFPLSVLPLFSKTYRVTLMLIAMAIASLILPMIARGDWMMQYRLMHPFFMLIYVLAGVGIMAAVGFYGRNRFSYPILALIILGTVAIAGSSWASVAKRAAINQNLTTQFESVRKTYHEFNSAVADTLMIPRPTILAPDLGATGYFGGLTVYDVGNLADYHFARYQYRDYFDEYVFYELKPHFLTYQGAAVARYTRMKQYPELERDYITYSEIQPDPNDSGVYSGHYIRKDIVIKQTLPWMADPAEYTTGKGCRLLGSAIPYAINPESGRVAVVLYWQTPSRAENDKFRIMFTDAADHVLADTLLSVGYDWYKPHQWQDTGYVCQYLFIPIPDSLEEGSYILSITDGTGDRYDLKRVGYHRKTAKSKIKAQYGYEDFTRLEAQRSRQFSGILHQIAECGVYMKMLRADYWKTEEGQVLIGNYIWDNFAENDYIDPSLVDLFLGILAEIRSLNPIQKDVLKYGALLNRYYDKRGDEYLEKGWRYYGDALDCYVKAIKASGSFPKVRKKLEANRPWASYLKSNPELLTDYDELLTTEKWLEIYREFERGSKFKYRPFRKLFFGHLVDYDQVRDEWSSLTVLDRMHLLQLGIVSGSAEDSYLGNKPQSTFGGGKLVLAECRIKRLVDRQYLFEAVFIPQDLPDRNYALSINLFAPEVGLLPEQYRQRGSQPYSFGTIPALWQLPDDEPSYVWRILELDYDPVKFNVTVYVPGGPPWYPLNNDNPGDNYIIRPSSPISYYE
jgi:4-amino-4-deoxy-L-arabinose transferase-like glycosyltransferase